MKKPKIYIAGPMSGRENFNREAFDAAAADLGARGWCAINPVDLERLWPCEDGGEIDGVDLDNLAAIEFKAVERADAIYLLKGWERSAGAQGELREFLKSGMRDGASGAKVLLEGNEIPEPHELEWPPWRAFAASDGVEAAETSEEGERNDADERD